MNSPELGISLLIAMVSMAISMAIIPVMIRYASSFGMIDVPDPRKVHATPVPRVGGVGIVVGSLLPLLIWLPVSDLMVSFIFGCLVLLIFGVWDDIVELGHYAKFFGQFIAVIAVVYYGDLYVQYFPFVGLETIPASVGKPFTVVALVGVINALNHSDGLDGLAGGESMLSFGAVAYLSYMFDGSNSLLISSAIIGGVFGFLRFNSHPANVFMGDGGSQFIGFALGVVVLMLTQQVNHVLSPALPLLLIGLPIIDILAVFFLRAKGKMNLFKATNNHVHHRLLGLGFYHFESVIIIYSVQILFVVSAVFLIYENDYFITAVYLALSTMLFTVITVCERRGWKVHRHGTNTLLAPVRFMKKYAFISILPQLILEYGISLFLIASALMIETVPLDFGVSAIVMLCLLLLAAATGFLGIVLYRLIIFITIGFSVYLLSSYSPAWLLDEIVLVYLFFIILAVAAFISARQADTGQFRITPLDYLVIAVVMIIGLMPGTDAGSSSIVWMAIQMIILFYLAELLIQGMKSTFNRLTGVLIVSLLLLATRGLL